MPDVFISYKRENEAKVGRLVAALKARGLDVWWDRDIPPGAPWEATIEGALNGAKAVIVCWSRAAVASENVRAEARLARNQGRLIQLFLEPCEPPLFFGERQGVDLASWRGKADDARIEQLAGAVRAIIAGKPAPAVPSAAPRSSSWMSRRGLLVAALALLIAVAAGWWLLRPGASDGPVTLAVLPFRALDATDANLAEAIGDDTRAAIGRNPNLRVLGRLAVSTLAEQRAAPEDYQRKVGADYLLDGAVQRVGDQVRIKVGLVRAGDGAEVWSDQLGGSLDNIFDFQSRIAAEVEGRVRGRLAPGRGIKPENITTSGQVYAIFAEARAHNRKRDPEHFRQGIALLKKAVALDPNFAPAWAELGVATRISGNFGDDPLDKVNAEAKGYLRRALTLAPNLATAHGGLAMVQDLTPETEPLLKKAVELDPNDAQTWLWYANMYGAQNKSRDAAAGYARARAIEPMWSTPIGNGIQTLAVLGDDPAIADLLAQVDRTGDPVLAAKTRFYIALYKGRTGEAVRLLLRLRSEHPEEASYANIRLYEPLLQLGFVNEVGRLFEWPADVVRFVQGQPLSAAVIRSLYKRPIDLWLDEPALLSRQLARQGRHKEFAGYYRQAFRSTDDFFNASPRISSSNVAVILRAGGDSKEADAILNREEQAIATLLRNGPAPPDLLFAKSQLRAAQGRDVDAVRLLGQALAKNWLPPGTWTAHDIADEPCFARLVTRSDFQALRKRILARIEAERRIAAPAVAAAKL